jgi:hypothetical protein
MSNHLNEDNLPTYLPPMSVNDLIRNVISKGDDDGAKRLIKSINALSNDKKTERKDQLEEERKKKRSCIGRTKIKRDDKIDEEENPSEPPKKKRRLLITYKMTSSPIDGRRTIGRKENLSMKGTSNIPNTGEKNSPPAKGITFCDSSKNETPCSFSFCESNYDTTTVQNTCLSDNDVTSSSDNSTRNEVVPSKGRLVILIYPPCHCCSSHRNPEVCSYSV